jgi:hypothetical protein
MVRNQIIGVIGLLIGILGIIRGLFMVENAEIPDFGLPGLFVVLGLYYLLWLDKKLFR